MIQEIIESFKEEDLKKGGYFYKDGVTLYVSEAFEEFRKVLLYSTKTDDIDDFEDALSYFRDITLLEVTVCGFVNMQGEYEELASAHMDIVFNYGIDGATYDVCISAKENIYSNEYLNKTLNIEEVISDIFGAKSNLEFMVGDDYVPIFEEYFSLYDEEDTECIINFMKHGVKDILLCLADDIYNYSVYNIYNKLASVEKNIFAVNSIANFMQEYDINYKYYKNKEIEEMPCIKDSKGNISFNERIMKSLVKKLLSRTCSKGRSHYYGNDFTLSLKKNIFDFIEFMMDEDINFYNKMTVLYKSLLKCEWITEREF